MLVTHNTTQHSRSFAQLKIHGVYSRKLGSKTDTYSVTIRAVRGFTENGIYDCMN